MTVDPRIQRYSATFTPQTIHEIHRAADQGLYEIRGFGAKRHLPTFASRRSRSISRFRSPSPG